MRAHRGRPSDSQLKNYENAADRDVLCWIYENTGKCRYGQKCQWLHLDRETGQYIPTVYMMNSLGLSPDEKRKKKKDGDDDNEEKKKEEEDDDNDEDEEDGNARCIEIGKLKTKFQTLMERNIKTRIEEEKTKKLRVDQNEEDNKEQSKGDSPKMNGDRKKSSGANYDESKEEEQGNGGGGNGKRGQYGSYGTTFDRFNVCWEFNTFVGCRKGAKCKWAHAYLVKESAHPYTGEKLNGMAVRKFRINNNI